MSWIINLIIEYYHVSFKQLLNIPTCQTYLACLRVGNQKCPHLAHLCSLQYHHTNPFQCCNRLPNKLCYGYIAHCQLQVHIGLQFLKAQEELEEKMNCCCIYNLVGIFKWHPTVISCDKWYLVSTYLGMHLDYNSQWQWLCLRRFHHTFLQQFLF